MDARDIIQQGERAKYQLTIDREGFSMAENDFTLELAYGMKGESITIEKADMTIDDDGKYYFSFDTSGMTQIVTATCTFQVPDTDCPDNIRTEVNRQYLCFVVSLPFPLRLCIPAYSADTEEAVSYEREAFDTSLYEVLLTSDGERVVTKDSMYVFVKTE